MQYQNDTELAKGEIFKAQYFRYYEEYKIDYDFQTAKVRVKDRGWYRSMDKGKSLFLGVT